MARRSPTSRDKRLKKIPGGGDHGTAERWQHSGRALELTDRAGILAVRATEEHVLDVLLLRNLIGQIQLDAGLKFKSDYHAASLAAHVTGSYSGSASTRDFFRGEYERSDAQEAAYRRWRMAVTELGKRRSAAVIATVCHDAPPGDRDLALLQSGLEKLAQLYRMQKQGSLHMGGKE